MIETKVVFVGDLIHCCGMTIRKRAASYFVENSEGFISAVCVSLEEAIKYCLEN